MHVYIYIDTPTISSLYSSDDVAMYSMQRNVSNKFYINFNCLSMYAFKIACWADFRLELTKLPLTVYILNHDSKLQVSQRLLKMIVFL